MSFELHSNSGGTQREDDTVHRASSFSLQSLNLVRSWLLLPAQFTHRVSVSTRLLCCHLCFVKSLNLPTLITEVKDDSYSDDGDTNMNLASALQPIPFCLVWTSESAKASPMLRQADLISALIDVLTFFLPTVESLSLTSPVKSHSLKTDDEEKLLNRLINVQVTDPDEEVMRKHAPGSELSSEKDE
ncbi:unnamed protein product, partial [Protopolystoma xenopodis]